MKRLIVLFFIAVAFVGQAQKGKVAGKVVDRKSGDAVEYASVVLLNPNDSSMVKGVGAVTASNGSFTLTAPYGTYLVR
ncbi:MAG: carboxypeptidase regulatory-like domain-containing protein, partial [Bacteroidales bacterium]|nr:carboxypeptidase regulatory-like domain-containing protein [Bacteroidales bacterium]